MPILGLMFQRSLFNKTLLKFPKYCNYNFKYQFHISEHPKTRAFITHCGLNSLNEAAFAGVPLISVPLFGDQNYNNAIVLHTGIGVTLDKFNLTTKNIVEALHEVLTNEK